MRKVGVIKFIILNCAHARSQIQVGLVKFSTPDPLVVVFFRRPGKIQSFKLQHARNQISTLKVYILVPRAYDLFGQRWDRWALVSAITGCREIHDIR